MPLTTPTATLTPHLRHIDDDAVRAQARAAFAASGSSRGRTCRCRAARLTLATVAAWALNCSHPQAADDLARLAGGMDQHRDDRTSSPWAKSAWTSLCGDWTRSAKRYFTRQQRQLARRSSDLPVRMLSQLPSLRGAVVVLHTFSTAVAPFIALILNWVWRR